MKVGHAQFYASAAVATIALFAFMPCVANDFVDWDDYAFVTENPHLRELSQESLLWMLTSFYQGVWHPLTWLSHALDRVLWGLNPSAHHLVSVVLHAMNGALVFFVCLILQDVWNERNPRRRTTTDEDRIVTAFAAGLFFVIHPLRVESVAWISARKDLLCAFFFLAAVVSYVKYVRLRDASHHGGVYYACAVAFHGAAILSKPTAVTLPFVLLLLDYYPLYRLKRSELWQRLAEKAPFLVLSGIAVVMNIAAKWGDAIPFSYVPASIRVMNAFHSIITYIMQTVLPTTLIPLYPMDLSIDYMGPMYLAAAGLVTAVTAVCVVLALQERRLWLIVWLYYLVVLTPSLGLFMSFRHCAADRYTYLPSLGLCLLAGVGVGRLWDVTSRFRRSSLAHPLLFLLVLSAATAYAMKTQGQIAVWRDTETLWYHVKEHARPIPDIAYFAIGRVHEDKGDFKWALEYYRQALSENPTSSRFKEKVATALAKSGDTEEALRLASQLVRDDPTNPDAYVILGQIKGEMGRYDEAVAAFEQALAIESQYRPALALLIVAHLNRNDLSRARYYYKLYKNKGGSVPREILERLKAEPGN